MKQIKIRVIAAALCLMGAASSCSLNVVPPEDIAAENFWKTEKDAWYGLNSIYSTLTAFNIWPEMCVDNAHSHKPWEGPFENMQMNGISTSDDRGYSFGVIRLVNNFLEKVDGCQMDADLRERMKAEARFFRAQDYLRLTRLFGKVPLVTTVMEYDAPNVKRDEVAVIQKFVLDELSAVAEILPKKYSGGFCNETSRVTRYAALAVKAQAALQFGNFAVAEAAAGLVISEGQHSLFRMTAELNDAQKKEADEMDQFIDFATLGINKDKFVRGMFSYETLWHEVNAKTSNPEYILTREYLPTANNNDWTRYIYIRPSQLITGYASFEPMQDLISAYWDIDGKTIRADLTMADRKTKFDAMWEDFKGLSQSKFIEKVGQTDLSTYDYMAEFRNRDSRLYASMLFPYKGWHETDFKGAFYYRVDPKDIGTNGNECWTGYAFRKMASLTPYDNWASFENYPVIRYAEVLLIFAEARTQTTGYDGEVQAALNDLRDRVGMPDVPTSLGSKQEALDFIRNERRIELAGEGQRFDDIRRYGKEYCAKVMSGTTYAPNGYVVVNKSWGDRLMLMPIPQSAIDTNPLLAGDQNPGYN